MDVRILSRKSIATVAGAAMLAAVAGAAMLAVSSTSSPAFTLSAPSLERPVAAAGVEPVWWDRWGRWHPGPGWRWRRWGWGPGWGPRWGWGPRYGFGPAWRCWWSPWGFRRCGWV
jgi:hypothetical protein